MASLQVPGLSASEASQLQSQLKPPHFNLTRLIRPNILSLQPYRCARDDYQSGILLDANENSIGPSLPAASSSSSEQGAKEVNGNSAAVANGMTSASALDSEDFSSLSLHRYPDPSLFGIRARLTELRALPSESHVFLGVGSDEVLDLIQRVIGTPGKDKICICPPTYGMYSVCAAVNDLAVVKVPLRAGSEEERFTLDVDEILSTLESDPSIKILFICSPGNPTGTLIPLSQIQTILDSPRYSGLVVVDEAYIDFAETQLSLGTRSATSPTRVSAVSLVTSYANLIVTQTLSKAYGLAAIRLGVAYAAPPLITVMNTTKAPYNISNPAAYIASRALSPQGMEAMRANVQTLMTNRDGLARALWEDVKATGRPLGKPDANFLLVPVLDQPRDVQGAKPDGKRAAMVYKRMAEEHAVVVRDRSKELGCDGCLRITVGTEEENRRCVQLMKELLQ